MATLAIARRGLAGPFFEVAGRAGRDEVRFVVTAALDDGHEVIDVGCRGATGAVVGVAFEDALPQLPPLAG